MEAELALPGGGTKLVIVAGQPIDMGDQPCMLFTFADLEPRRKAESALRHSEERFTRTFQMARCRWRSARAMGMCCARSMPASPS